MEEKVLLKLNVEVRDEVFLIIDVVEDDLKFEESVWEFLIKLVIVNEMVIFVEIFCMIDDIFVNEWFFMDEVLINMVEDDIFKFKDDVGGRVLLYINVDEINVFIVGLVVIEWGKEDFIVFGDDFEGNLGIEERFCVVMIEWLFILLLGFDGDR